MPWQYPMFSMLNEKSSEPPKNHVWAEVGKEPKRHFLFGLLLTRRSQEFFVGPRKRHHSLQALEQKRLLKIDGRPTDALPFEVDSYLDTVGNLDKGNATIHAVLLSVEGHCPFDCSEPVPSPVIVKFNFSCLVTPRIVKSPSNSIVSEPVCTAFEE